jgi:Kef-type K+ transport system membrane component KefB
MRRGSPLGSISVTPTELSITFFVQLFVIVAAARSIGWLGKRFLGQPQVVGEMIAGVILGPSLFGLLVPNLSAVIFPADSKPILYVGAQLGVGLYMFLVGLGFDRDHFAKNVGSAGAVSLSGMAVPFLLAIALAPWLMSEGLFSEGMTLAQGMLFLGACIAITAFPMLARIIHERGLSKSPLGTLSLSAGAIDDACAWCVLAIVLATFGAGTEVAVKAIASAVGFAVLMVGFGPRLFARLGREAERKGGIDNSLLGIVLMLFLLSAFAMDWAGMHAVFGGFLLGTAMPRGVLTREIRAKLEPVTVVLLLPMFFTYSGLNTKLSVMTDPALFLIAAAVLAASILAKFGACWAAARLTGQDNPTALGIGALMNSRGLMELIIINIGLQRGLIGVEFFSIMVLMAVVTTLMASPLFELVYGRRARERGELGALSEVTDDPVEIVESQKAVP